MGLEAILQAISAAGDAEVRQIEARACTQEEEILADAWRESAQVKEKAFNAAVTPVARESSRIIHEAKLEMLYRMGNVRETLVDTALERGQARLAGIRAKAIYPRVLRQLVNEALVEIASSSGESGRVFLEIDPRDRVLIDQILSAMKLNLPILDNLNCWGGLIARSEDDRVVVINTLEARLERATPSLRRYLAGLFEDKECRILTTATPAYVP
jgi:V/A-type H+-transporting ATPase subunit E